MTLPPILSTPAVPRSEAPRPMFSALAIASSGLSAQRVRMEVIAQNLANAETTRTAQGGPYQRKIVNLEAINPIDGTAINPTSPTALNATATGATGVTGVTGGTANGSTTVNGAAGPSQTTAGSATATDPTAQSADVTGGVRIASLGEDKTPGAMIYDPGHPDADKNGYVHMPNVNITDEMMDLMNARRLYEANATMFQVARAMLHKAIDI